MANTWHIPHLENSLKQMENSKEHVERIKSVSRAIDIFEYHLYTAKDSNDSIEASNPREAMELVFIPEGKHQSVFETKLAIQANTQASIHSARSIYDLFAQLVNGLLLAEPLAVHKCDFFKLKDKLPESELKEHLNQLSSTQEFLYVNAFVNTLGANIVVFNSKLPLLL